MEMFQTEADTSSAARWVSTAARRHSSIAALLGTAKVTGRPILVRCVPQLHLSRVCVFTSSVCARRVTATSLPAAKNQDTSAPTHSAGSTPSFIATDATQHPSDPPADGQGDIHGPAQPRRPRRSSACLAFTDTSTDYDVTNASSTSATVIAPLGVAAHGRLDTTVQRVSKASSSAEARYVLETHTRTQE